VYIHTHTHTHTHARARARAKDGFAEVSKNLARCENDYV